MCHMLSLCDMCGPCKAVQMTLRLYDEGGVDISVYMGE